MLSIFEYVAKMQGRDRISVNIVNSHSQEQMCFSMILSSTRSQSKSDTQRRTNSSSSTCNPISGKHRVVRSESSCQAMIGPPKLGGSIPGSTICAMLASDFVEA